MQAGMRGETAVLIEHGFVKISMPTAGGREALLSVRVSGDLVGEVAVLNDQPRSASATACCPGLVRVITKDRLRDFLGSHPDAAMQLTGMVADRLRWANERRVDAVSRTVEQRLARVLTEMASAYGMRTSAGVEIAIDLTQDEISTLISVSEVTAHRALKALRDLELIKTGYRRIIVADIKVLRSFAHRHEVESCG